MARPGYPGFVKVTQPDGSTLSIRLHGDEWGHWATNAAGRVVRMDTDGFYREVPENEAQLMMESIRVKREAGNRVRQMSADKRHVAQGQKHFLVILVEFQDQDFDTQNPQETVSKMLNESGYSGNGATGSARDYYYQSSNGYFEPIFDVYGPVTLSQNMKYYGGNDSSGNDLRPEEAVKEGCELLNSQIDYSQYDNDNDGRVDMVFMFYAGYGEADGGSSNTIWPHMYYLSYLDIDLILDGKKVDKYACANELAGYGPLKGKLDGIGGVCHEFGHAMGLPDFYDSDSYNNGAAGGLYDFSLMCSGSYNNYSRTPPMFNMVERILLGWQDETSAYKEFTKNGTVSIPEYRPDQGDPVAYMTPTDMDNEFFIYESRGSGSVWDSHLPGYGLVAYHVDKSNRTIKIRNSYVKVSELWDHWENYNAVNENGSHPCFYVVPAPSQKNYNFDEHQTDQLPFPGTKNVKSFTPVSWNGVASDISFSDISFAGNTVTMTVSGLPDTPGDDPASFWLPVIANPGKGVYTVGESFALSLAKAPAGFQTVVWYWDGVQTEADSVALTAGDHEVEAVLSLEDGKTAAVSLRITVK